MHIMYEAGKDNARRNKRKHQRNERRCVHWGGMPEPTKCLPHGDCGHDIGAADKRSNIFETANALLTSGTVACPYCKTPFENGTSMLCHVKIDHG